MKQISKRFDCMIINKNTKKLNHIIRLGKDKLDVFEKFNTVYKIDCQSCDASYIGQSSRKLACRINESEKPKKQFNILCLS